jgi:hypothetical protein
MVIHKATLAFALVAMLIAGQLPSGGTVLDGSHFQGTPVIDVISQSPTARGPRKGTTLPVHGRSPETKHAHFLNYFPY